jgi:hypothetical protein
MRFVALLVAMAIICVLVLKRAQPSQVAEAMSEADAVVAPAGAPAATATPAAAAQSGTSLRAPLDRTRAVLGQVKRQNAEAEY